RRVPIFRTKCAAETVGGAALASIAEGIPVAGLGWSDHERGSEPSRSGRRNSEGPVGTGTREAQAAHAPGPRATTSCGSDLHCVAKYGKQVSSNQEQILCGSFDSHYGGPTRL